jgi:hypothetical protein
LGCSKGHRSRQLRNDRRFNPSDKAILLVDSNKEVSGVFGLFRFHLESVGEPQELSSIFNVPLEKDYCPHFVIFDESDNVFAGLVTMESDNKELFRVRRGGVGRLRKGKGDETRRADGSGHRNRHPFL